MRYGDQDRESQNVEDRRSERGPMFRFPGRFPGGAEGTRIQIPLGGGGISLSTLLIIGVIMLLLGINPLDLLSEGQYPQVPQMPQSEVPKAPGRQASRGPEIPGLPGGTSVRTEDDMKRFVSQVLADTEDVWTQVFAGFGKRYPEPAMVLFTGATRTACGTGVAQMGPFYCPLDRKIYIDLSFYDLLKRRFEAPGDFAQAYVIAHEVGHHVQKLLGIADKVQELKMQSDETDANALQVRMELQADCLAGVWANLNDQVKNRLQPGDVEEGLNAASQIGDDMIQRRTQGQVVPDAFTHGSSAQRVRWFKRGLEGGEVAQCDTFNTSSL
ncbi:MAG: neutral zinc metallopeptidase [Hyphomicrobium sp.]|uniref:KPN_02809 family neutral zinc metallopeptidase n=1 Tax=Hyphomicrobium sp. TaxID=82 RepID=UPI001324FC53|nr:neutral zinc metallopeptidase [Hyphomicrobium sp.]KAB2940272.1 MAG: metalloprotease [Hyphomicrobium sp.]MBZ0211088.1 neutral zinc metallopeptidase [Hyphomicrobium sp.]